jgi:hypothetical protein
MRVKFPRLPQRPRPPAADPRLDIALSTNLKAAAQRLADGIWTYVVRQVCEVIFMRRMVPCWTWTHSGDSV